MHDDQHRLRDASARDVIPLAPAATLSDALCRDVTPSEFAAALFRAVRDTWDPAARDLEVDGELAGRARELEMRYASSEWTWRE